MTNTYWKRIIYRMTPRWYMSRFNKSKVLLAFEFGLVLRDAASDLGITLTSTMVLRAEDIVEEELGKNSSSHFASRMGMYALAILEPKD